jgi:hypothetical protein
MPIGSLHSFIVITSILRSVFLAFNDIREYKGSVNRIYIS